MKSMRSSRIVLYLKTIHSAQVKRLKWHLKAIFISVVIFILVRCQVRVCYFLPNTNTLPETTAFIILLLLRCCWLIFFRKLPHPHIALSTDRQCTFPVNLTKTEVQCTMVLLCHWWWIKGCMDSTGRPHTYATRISLKGWKGFKPLLNTILADKENVWHFPIKGFISWKWSTMEITKNETSKARQN